MNTKNYQKEFSKESIDIYLKKLSKVYKSNSAPAACLQKSYSSEVLPSLSTTLSAKAVLILTQSSRHPT